MKRKLQNGLALLSRALFFLLALVWLPSTALAGRYIAFIGDSITTGAVTHPALEFDKKKLWNIFRGALPISADLAYWQEHYSSPLNDLNAPTRLHPSIREYLSPGHWMGQNLINSFSAVYLDTEEYSWAYAVARSQGYDADQILIAAQDGARMTAGPRQIDRIFAKTGGMVPEKVYVFFTGNDLCGPLMELTRSADQYKSDLKGTLEYLLRNGKISSAGTEIYVLSFLSIMQLTTSDSILSKVVRAHGKDMTCKELAEGGPPEASSDDAAFLQEHPESSLFFSVFPSTPAAMCATVFGVNPDAEKNQSSDLANRIRVIRRLSAEVVVDFSKRYAEDDRVNFHFVEGTANLIFEPRDIANDCFHLSIDGQAKISRAVLGQ